MTSGKRLRKHSLTLTSSKPPAISLWMSVGYMAQAGVHSSIFSVSTWPYLSSLDSTITIDFLGVVLTTASLGGILGNPFFGFWTQRTLGVINPTIAGGLTAATGHLLYGLLPLFREQQEVRYLMLIARFLIGFGGVGLQAVHRSYLATAPVPGEDQLKMMSRSYAGILLGFSLGPALQTIFSLAKEEGFSLGPIVFNMYTLPAFTMVIVGVTTAITFQLFFREEYAGIKECNDSDEDSEPLPSYDLVPALICIYLYIIDTMMDSTNDSTMTPMTIAMYNWNDEQAVFYNGIVQMSCYVAGIFVSLVIGSTWIGRLDKRLLILFGLTCLVMYQFIMYPWSFYSGPLDYIPENRTVGGCESSYTWCETTTRVPKPLYMVSYVLLCGVGFPFLTTSGSYLYAEILGPRRQGFMQGLYAFGGSFINFALPMFSTYMYQESGFRYIVLIQIIIIVIGQAAMVVYFRRMVPLMSYSRKKQLAFEPTPIIKEAPDQASYQSCLFTR